MKTKHRKRTGLWQTEIIVNDAIHLGKRIQNLMENEIPFRVSIEKGVFNEDVVMLQWMYIDEE